MNKPKSTLVELCGLLKQTFEQDPPLFSKSTASATIKPANQAQFIPTSQADLNRPSFILPGNQVSKLPSPVYLPSNSSSQTSPVYFCY